MVEGMQLPPNATVSGSVFTRLVEEILSGRWPAERPAPSERELALTLQVNRHSVREALKRLQQAGLVRIGQGGKTMVLDWRSNAGLDMLAALTAAAAVPLTTAVLDTAVMRRTVGTDAARLCALRADEQQLAAVSAAAAEYPESGDINAFRDADLELWTAIVIGSGNITYRLALNTLVRSIDEIGREFYVNLDAEAFMDRQIHLDLAAALCRRDAELAEVIAYKSLSPLIDMFGPEAPQ
jgi:GntR family transcriptional regulator, transcriptional repressor for pyruvate dehydrogenase complex